MQVAMIPIGICEKIEAIVRQFVWGSLNRGRKVALVNWDDCYQSVQYGGIGIRRLVPQNVSFLMKLAYNIVMKRESL